MRTEMFIDRKAIPDFGSPELFIDYSARPDYGEWSEFDGANND